ncbi:hypothetical protein BC831DRAFT_49935 [Entophlyctis helioformis]|nr:hypothetical protein BC831DRAFT_49935 [Entophlyctis helioformis]
MSKNDYHDCYGRGIAAAVKFVNKQFDAAAKKRGFNNPADFCALLHDRMEAMDFAYTVGFAYYNDLLKVGGVALAKTFLNAFAVFILHEESGALPTRSSPRLATAVNPPRQCRAARLPTQPPRPKNDASCMTAAFLFTPSRRNTTPTRSPYI